MTQLFEQVSKLAFIGLGSNLGDKEQTLRLAVDHLSKHDAIQLAQCSKIYKTEPFGPIQQPNFLNMVVRVETTLTPERLLDVLLHTEQLLGRTREIRWGPRTCDLDLLWVENTSIHSEKLTLPHPGMLLRLFVLRPLLEVVPQESQYQVFQSELTLALKQLEGKQHIAFYKSL